MGVDPLMPDGDSARVPGTATEHEQHASASVTRTMVTPRPEPSKTGDEPGGESAGSLARAWKRIGASGRRELTPPTEPLHAIVPARMAMTAALFAVCLMSVGGAVLLLLLWQQDQASGVLSSQVDRTWDLFAIMVDVERVAAVLAVPCAMAWAALAAVNVKRATGQGRNPVVVALSIPFGVGGAWLVGARIVAEADDWVARASGMVLQAVFVAVPLLALERVALASECRRRPLRVTYVVAVLYLALLQGLGGLSTIDATSDESFGVLGAYLVIGALLLAIGTLSANEAARAVEEGTEHRYQLRHRFGESLLAQVERT